MNKIPNRKINSQCSMPSIMLGSYQIKEKCTLKQMLSTSLRNGLVGFDTSPSYGNLNLFGTALRMAMDETECARDQLFISGKIDGWQMCRNNGNVKECVLQSLKQLDIAYYDCLLVHWPFRNYLTTTWSTFEKLYEEGIVKSIGLCNVNERFLKEYLPKLQIMPHVVQIEISPLRVANDDVAFLQNLGIQVQAYSPLCRMMPEISGSIVLRSLAEKYKKNIAQIILRWHIQKGVIPIFTSSKIERIISNVDIFNFSLDSSEIAQIDKMNRNYKIFPESYGCPGF